jgi:hypothetical protein
MIATVSLRLLYLIFQQVLGLVLGGAGSRDRARRAVRRRTLRPDRARRKRPVAVAVPACRLI